MRQGLVCRVKSAHQHMDEALVEQVPTRRAEVAQGRVAPYTAPMPRPVLRKVLQYYIA